MTAQSINPSNLPKTVWPLDAHLIAALKPAPSAKDNALQQLAGSFLYEAKQESFALAQIAGLGDTVERGQEPLQADNFLGANAQILGRAAADMIPAVVIGLTARAGFSKFLPPATTATEHLLLKRSPIGLNALEAGTSGLLTGSLLRPSAQDPSQDPSGFLLDRAEGGFAGAASFSALTGINSLGAKLGARANSSLVKTVLTNPISNILLPGASAGLFNAELNSVASTGHLTADLSVIGKSVYEMSLIAGVSSLVGLTSSRLAARTSFEPQSKAALASPAAAEQSESPLSPNRTASAPESSPPERIAIRQRSDEEDLTGRLPYRRYLSPRGSDPTLEAKPLEEQWALRADALSQRIAERINRLQPSEAEFWRALDHYSEPDRPIVKRLLESAAGNATDTALTKSMQSIYAQADRFGSHPVAETPGSAGNMLGYLYRKLNARGGMQIRYLGDRDNLDRAIIFEDIASLSPDSLARIVREAAVHQIDLVDMNFDRLPNMVDFARGDVAVHAKLDRILAQTKHVMSNQPDLSIEQAVENTLRNPADALLSRLQPSHGLRIIRPQALSVQEAFQERVQVSDIKTFLETNEGLTHIEARIMAAEVLADDVEFHSIPTIVDRLKPLSTAIEASARQQHLNPNLDRFIVDIDNFGSSSEAFMTYLYSQVNGIDASRIMTQQQFKRYGHEPETLFAPF